MNETRFLLVIAFTITIQFALIPSGALLNQKGLDPTNIRSKSADSTVPTTPQVKIETLPLPRNQVAWENDYKGYLKRFNKSLDRNHLAIYRATRTDVFRHNNYGKNSWKKGINIFSDMTDAEVKDHMGYNGDFPKRSKRSLKDLPPLSDLPPSLDYRSKSIVSPVKDQGDCGCCFAFATVSVMESKYAMLNVNIDLSEQHIVDCLKTNGSGCHGGSFKKTLQFMEDVGVDTESNNAYTALGNQSCKVDKRKYDHRVMKWMEIEQDERYMVEALLKHGPIAASLFVDTDFRTYADGIFDASSDGNVVPNHAVVIVGYGRVNETDVWYIRNSWGESWGEGGYMTLKRNVNLRGIADGAFAIVNVAAVPGKRQEGPEVEDKVSHLGPGFFPPDSVESMIVVFMVFAFCIAICIWRIIIRMKLESSNRRMPDSTGETGQSGNCELESDGSRGSTGVRKRKIHATKNKAELKN